MATTDLRKWLEDSAYLPESLRDFHAQKDLFKTLHHETLGYGAGMKAAGERHFEVPSWVDGHVYVIDFFLHFMARHGYTLQRSRARLPFEVLEARHRERREQEASVLMSAFFPSPRPSSPEGES